MIARVAVGKDLNLTGAAILSDNLTLNITKATNKQELKDTYYSESMSLGISTTLTAGAGQSTIPGTGGKPNSFPGGATTIEGGYNQNESERTTYATIGGLNSTLTSATNEMLGADFEGSLTVDHRLFTKAGRDSILRDFTQLPQNLKTMRESGEKSPLKIGGKSLKICFL